MYNRLEKCSNVNESNDTVYQRLTWHISGYIMLSSIGDSPQNNICKACAELGFHILHPREGFLTKIS